jgi:hypothetical protein
MSKSLKSYSTVPVKGKNGFKVISKKNSLIKGKNYFKIF